MRVAAFLAFTNGAGGEKTYDAFLSGLGLSENKNRMNKKVKKQIAENAYKKANHILKMFKKKKL